LQPFSETYGEDKISLLNCSINFRYKLSVFLTGIDQHEDV